MKIIFLDIDGVLNSTTSDIVRNHFKNNEEMNYVAKENFDLLKVLVDESKSHIVISSTWRKDGYFLENACGEENIVKKFQDFFSSQGWENAPIIGITPNLSGLMNRIITGFVMIVSFFFILKNGYIFRKNYHSFFLDTLGEKSIPYIDNAILALRGTINGVVLVGLVEGILLSFPLLLAGFPSGFVIGLTAGILGVIPLLMPLLIIPCLIYIYFSISSVIAIFGFVDLIVVWFLFENLIKPSMISKKVKINSLIILMSMIGGMQLLGLVGLFTGPAIVSMSIGLLKDLFKVEQSNS